MAELQICLLGSFQASWDFKPVSGSAWGDARAIRLLKLVLLRRPDPVPEEEVAKLLGLADPAALTARVNQVIQPAAALQIWPSGAIGFHAGEACWIDLDAMLHHYQTGVSAALRGEMMAAVLAFQEADGLYQGDLLEEVQEPWVTEPRKRLRAIYTEILDRLAEGHAVLARYQDAVGFCHKALAHDPLREVTYQRMMVYYYYLGDMSGARDAYQACRQALEENRRPVSEETISLWERLNRREVSVESPALLAAPAVEPPQDPSGKTGGSGSAK
ncbi:MAG: bacterial transcriptional activator domain-containing protein [Bacillota bacterium]